MRLVALGDSLSCGEGVGLRVPVERTWVGLLAAALPGAELVPLAAPGARVQDVVRDQLPRALAAPGGLTTVLAGLNDVARGGFDADAVAGGLHRCADALAPAGDLLLVRLHDPTAVLPLPHALRRAVQGRVAVVNAAVDEAAARTGAAVLDLGRVPGLTARGAWATDRLHPSATGHALVARAAAAVLRRTGARVRATAPPPDGAAPGTRAECAWLVAHGLPWLARHAGSVGVPLVTTTARGLRRTA